jgi:outer membrane receptor protein involved in Fe transport
LYAEASSAGILRNAPRHWVSLGGSFNLVKNMLDLNANLLVTAAYQDPDRYPSGRAPVPDGTTVSHASDLTWDQLTPVARLQLGFRLRFFHERLGISGQFYNVLNQRYYLPDPFYDVTPATEDTPTPAAGFSFFGAISYRL